MSLLQNGFTAEDAIRATIRATRPPKQRGWAVSGGARILAVKGSTKRLSFG